MGKFLKQLTCEHDWIWDEACAVHFPDYEPHKVGIKCHCSKCGKKEKELILPYHFIKLYGRRMYDRVIAGDFETGKGKFILRMITGNESDWRDFD